MHYRSRSVFQSLKTMPTGSENRSTGLMLQAGYIRQEMAGAYNYLPLGLNVLENISQIIREEMNAIGAEEVKLTALSQREKWDKTDRWDIDEYFFLPGPGKSEWRINPTHEELITPLLQEFLQSYKTVANGAGVYQIQTKFRKEKRAKSGLLRGREFLMKDLYSFHLSQEEFQAYFDKVADAYDIIFDRLGIGQPTGQQIQEAITSGNQNTLNGRTVRAYADGGDISDQDSVEFQTFTDIGEDLLFYDEVDGIWYNQELAPSCIPHKENETDEQAFQRHEIKEIGVKDIAHKLGIEEHQTTKTLFFEKDESMIAVVVRGDYGVNTSKLRKVAGKGWQPASAEMIKALTGSEPGFAGLYNLPENIDVYVDDSVKSMKNFETGGNETGVHVTGCNWERDIVRPTEFYDLKEAKEGDLNPKTEQPYFTAKASETGNIFDIGTKYSSSFGLTITNENGIGITPIMGCYGIGVSRVMGIIAEVMMTEKGLSWPENIAPYTHYIIVHGADENLEKAEVIAQGIENTGGRVVIDDRKTGFGAKASDADLLGIPHRIIVSDKTLEQGGYELRESGKEEGEIIKL